MFDSIHDFLRCILGWLVVQPLSIDPPYAGIAYTRIPVFLKHVAVQSCWQVPAHMCMILQWYLWESHMNFETSFFHYGSHCSNFADMFSTWCIFVFRSNRPRHLTFCDVGAMRALYRVCRGSVQANSNVQDQPLDHDRHQDGWWWVWMLFCLIGLDLCFSHSIRLELYS